MKTLTTLNFATPHGLARVTRMDNESPFVQFKVIGPDGTGCLVIGARHGTPGNVVIVVPGALQITLANPRQFGPRLNLQWVDNWMNNRIVLS